ncbi:hypothetical protein [uncultured Jatrophihabitans sp.]|uniref:hypothetical protein n=1 Tax=uncultured Jatrophihabitans sp. TaxID=1610747 RepID=UPI0035CBC1F1
MAVLVRVRVVIAAVLMCLGVGAVAAAPQASAYPWDPHIQVWFNASQCTGSSGTWGWWSNDAGESGWVHWNAGYQGWFDEYRVGTSGSVTTIKWGLPGQTCVVRYFNITRPVYGNIRTLGWIG